jgi:outer membrane protein assembly factor BamB
MAVFAAPAADTNILWTTSLGKEGVIQCSAALAPDGSIYTTSFDTKLHALDSRGDLKWSFETAADIRSSPAVGTDGTVYFGSRDWKFYAVSALGKEQWHYTTGAWVDSSPAIADDGTIYFGGWDKQFYALDPSGRKKWQFATGGPIDSSAAIGADGTIYFGSHDHLFYALNPNGTKKWSFETGGPITSSPAIGADGTIYFSSIDGFFYALNPDGSKKWQLHTGGICHASPAIDSKGTLFFGVNGCLWAVDPEGQKRLWDYCVYYTNQFLTLEGTPALTADGEVLFTTTYGSLCRFTLDGTPATAGWPFFGGGLVASPAVGPDGTVYLGAGSTFFGIWGPAGLDASPWPKFRANARQTGRVNEVQSGGR